MSLNFEVEDDMLVASSPTIKIKETLPGLLTPMGLEQGGWLICTTLVKEVRI